ncbi:MAG: Gfo/Idh/MocA family oxidoreductase [Acidimicrobiia bacterium]|nr:Gfo/Idh/MocA family oxidoreductase [Acidimicrobiia bacterium]
MTPPRWGIMGTGGIAATMVSTLQDLGSPVVAVGSQRPDAARSFAETWSIPNAVSSHDAVAEADDVDVVYVATTNDRHHENVMACVAAGKAVLCEKPLALNLDQATDMLGAASRAGVFAMEAMWMRFLPFIAKLDELIADGAIGPVTHVAASFSFPAPFEPDRRWLNRQLGGGALLDLGIYPVSLIHHLLGPPVDFEASSRIAETGVDHTTQVISTHDNGAMATAACSFGADTANEAVVSGPGGRIRIHAQFHHSRRLTLERGGDRVESFDTDFVGHGFRFEVAEVLRCLEAGLIESPIRPHGDTLAVMGWLDAIRTRCGIAYEADG